MSSPHDIAVLVTYHNEGELLTRCLESVRDQTLRPREIIVYDDASTIRPEPFLPPAMGIRVIRGESVLGPARGRNKLLAASAAPLVHFHDADDAFAPTWAERVTHAFEMETIDACFTEVGRREPGAADRDAIIGLDALADDDDLVRFCLRGAMLVPAGTYRREAVEAIGGYRESLWQSEDWDFHVRLAASGIRFRVCLDSLVRLWIRPDSRSHQRVAVWTSAVEAVRELAVELPLEYRPDLAEAAARAGAQLYRAGAEDAAIAAFDLADRLGPPRLGAESGAYRLLTRMGGQATAERAGDMYRRILPERLRGLLAHWR